MFSGKPCSLAACGFNSRRGQFAGWIIRRRYQLNWIRERRAALADTIHVLHGAEGLGLREVPAPWPLGFLGEQGHDCLIVWEYPDKMEATEARLARLFPEAKIYSFLFAP